MGYGFFNAGIMTIVPGEVAPAKKKRICGKGALARRAARWLSIVSKKRDAVYPLV